MIEYPGISRDYILEMVHRFYDEYYFRPKAIFRIVKKAAFNSTERKRLYTRSQVVPEAARCAQSFRERGAGEQPGTPGIQSTGATQRHQAGERVGRSLRR